MNMAEFTVPGKPQGKARARTFYDARLGKMRSITPENTALYENLIKECFLHKVKTRWFNEEPLEVYITALFPQPKRMTKKEKAMREEGNFRPVKKPDSDNIAKVILDALNGVAWKDDSQVVKLTVEKFYSIQEPRVIVYIGEVEKFSLRGDENG